MDELRTVNGLTLARSVEELHSPNNSIRNDLFLYRSDIPD